MIYTGSCHCKKLKCEVKIDEIKEAMDCNCSICRRKGHKLVFVPKENFKGEYNAKDISKYKFNKNMIEHCFCKTCGCSPFGFGSDGKGNEMAAININCLDDDCYIKPQEIKINHYDGKNL